jgi:hypothetical protein
MAQRGRKPKVQRTPEETGYAELLKETKENHLSKMRKLYEDLARIKSQMNYALGQIGSINECNTLAESAFIAGKAYVQLDGANDCLEGILDDIYSQEDLDHWEDVSYEF